MSHSIGLEPESVVQSGGRDIFKVVRSIGVGGAVQVSCSDWLHGLDVPALVVFAPAEHQMLEQVRKPGLPGPLVLGAYVVPDIDGDDGCLVVFVNDQAQPILQDKSLVGNINCGRLRMQHGTSDDKQCRSELVAHGFYLRSKYMDREHWGSNHQLNSS